MLKKIFRPVDMTKGTPWKGLVLFAIPMLIGNIAQQLYSTVDSIIVGHFVGDNALAAVGSALPLLNLMLVLFIGISAGATIMVSQYFGARDKESLAATIGTCVTMTAMVSLALMILAPPLMQPFLKLLNTPADIIDDCRMYLIISMLGIAGMAFYNILSGILRGMGDSTSALVYLLIATGLNIVLDLFFVAVMGMGVPGVAVATAIAQGVSAALCMKKLTKLHHIFVLEKRHFRVEKKYVSRVVQLGMPSGATQAILSSAMIIVQSLTNCFGPMFIAANVIVMRVDGFAMMPNLTFGMAMTTYSGQNVGAGNLKRVDVGAKQGTIMAVACSATITAIILIFGKYLMAVFTDTAELVDLSVYLMRILAVGYVAMAVTQSLSGIMRGAGDTLTPMWISLCTTVLFRVPLAYGISYLTVTPELPFGRFECISISLVSAWVLGAILTTIFYRRRGWKKKVIAQLEAK